MKTKILFLSETVTMAHLLRPLKVASHLSQREYEVHFAATNIPAFLRKDFAQFQLHEICHGVSEAAFLNSISKGQHPYSEEVLKSYVQEDLRLLNEIKPDLVIGDMRLTLHISAKLANVPYLNISNSTWDSSVAPSNLVPDIPIVKLVGVTLAKAVFPMIRPLIMNQLAAPFNKVAQEYGVESYGSYYDVLTSGDRTIYADLKSLVSPTVPKKTKSVVGGLVYSMKSEGSSFNDLPAKQKTRVILTLGSSGPSALLQQMVDALAKLDIELIISTSGKKVEIPVQGTVVAKDYLPLEDVVGEADLLIFNGGSGTGYIGLAQAVPLLCIPSNIDQHQFSHALSLRGSAEILRSDKFSVDRLVELVTKMLSDESYKTAAQEIATEMRNENPIGEIMNVIESMVAHSKVSESVIETIVADALLSPSGDNCQPWKFRWNGESLLVLHHESRGAHSLNRANHASLLALGGVLESIEISASQFGLQADTKLLLKNDKVLSPWAEVRFTRTTRARDELASQLSKRHTDRRAYKGGNMSAPVFSEIESLSQQASLASVRKVATPSKGLLQYFIDSENFLWKNKRTVSDLLKWMRLNKKEITSSKDGMSWKNAGVNFVDALFLRVLRRFPGSFGLLWNLGFKQKVRSVTKKNIQSSAGLLCISVKKMNAESICEAGRLAFRTWVLLNSQGYGVQPMTFASTSIADMLSNSLPDGITLAEKTHLLKGYDLVTESFGLSEDEIPLWIFRTGVSEALPQDSRTARRDVREVLISYRRKNKRLPTPEFLIANQDSTFVQNVSCEGLGLVSRVEMPRTQEPQAFSICLADGSTLDVKARQVWQRRGISSAGEVVFSSGYELLSQPPLWPILVESLEERVDLRGEGLL